MAFPARLSPDDVEALLIAHGHTDHVGFARRPESPIAEAVAGAAL